MAITISGDAPNFTSASATTITGVTTLNASSGVLATQNGMTGIAKAWVNFQGGNGNTAGTINKSFNVSSVTYVSTGIYTISFTTAMPDANFSGQANSTYDNTSGGFNTMTTVANYATTGCSIYSGYPSSTLRNSNTVSVVIFN
jgi:hypothetical protein